MDNAPGFDPASTGFELDPGVTTPCARRASFFTSQSVTSRLVFLNGATTSSTSQSAHAYAAPSAPKSGNSGPHSSHHPTHARRQKNDYSGVLTEASAIPATRDSHPSWKKNMCHSMARFH